MAYAYQYISLLLFHLVGWGFLLCWIIHHWQSFCYTDTTTQGIKRERKNEHRSKYVFFVFSFFVFKDMTRNSGPSKKGGLRGHNQKHRHVLS
jgi:hypothetical protein